MIRKPLLSFISFLVCIGITLGQTAQRTLVKSFNIQQASEIFFDIDAPLEVIPWPNDLLRVQMQVSLEGGSDSVLKSLIAAQRYELVSNSENGLVTISAPGLQKTVVVGGKEAFETIRLKINLPEDMLLAQRETTVSTPILPQEVGMQ